MDPHTSTTITNERRIRLDAADESGFGVLVGCTFDGFDTRLCVDGCANELTGLALVNALQTPKFERLAATDSGLSRVTDGQFVLLSALNASAEHLQSLQSIAAALMLTWAFLEAEPEALAPLRRSTARIARYAWLADVRILVVLRGLRRYPDTRDESNEATWRNQQKDLAVCSRRSVHLIAWYSGYYTLLKQFEVVVNAIYFTAETARLRHPSRGFFFV